MRTRKNPIDLLKIYAEWDAKRWNIFLAAKLKSHDINALTDTLVRLQQGMDELAKQKLNTEAVCELFVRLQRSIENTLKLIFREQNDNPLYRPENKHLYDSHIDEKKRLDNQFEKYLQKNRW